MKSPEPQPFVGVGLHLGQGRQSTALCVVELQDRMATETTAGGRHFLQAQTPPDANDRYGAFQVGTQDDLVTALGLAVQAEPQEWHTW